MGQNTSQEAPERRRREAYLIDWPRIYEKRPFERNLLCNPCGTEQVKYWCEEVNRIDLEGAKSQTSSIIFWCEKSQIVDLLEEGLWEHLLDVHQPPICISDPHAEQCDCGCVYIIKVQLLAADKKTVLQEFAIETDPKCQVSHEFCNYGHGIRYVNFTHRRIDGKYQKACCGAWISDWSVIVKGDLLDPCAKSP